MKRIMPLRQLEKLKHTVTKKNAIGTSFSGNGTSRIYLKIACLYQRCVVSDTTAECRMGHFVYVG